MLMPGKGVSFHCYGGVGSGKPSSLFLPGGVVNGRVSLWIGDRLCDGEILRIDFIIIA